jgi:hypothetical protein
MVPHRMKPLLPKEIRVGVSGVTEVYDFGPLSAGFEIEEAEVIHCRSVGAGYVAVHTEYEQATYEQCAPEVRAAPQTIKEESQPGYVWDLCAMMRSFLV